MSGRQRISDVVKVAIGRIYPQRTDHDRRPAKLLSVAESVAVRVGGDGRRAHCNLLAVRKPVAVRVGAGWIRPVCEALVCVGKSVAVRVGSVADGDERLRVSVRAGDPFVSYRDKCVAYALRHVKREDLRKSKEICPGIDVYQVIDGTTAEWPRDDDRSLVASARNRRGH